MMLHSKVCNVMMTGATDVIIQINFNLMESELLKGLSKLNSNVAFSCDIWTYNTPDMKLSI